MPAPSIPSPPPRKVENTTITPEKLYARLMDIQNAFAENVTQLHAMIDAQADLLAAQATRIEALEGVLKSLKGIDRGQVD